MSIFNEEEEMIIKAIDALQVGQQELIRAVKELKNNKTVGNPVQLFSLRKTAEMLDVSIDTVREWVNAGTLPATKLLGNSYRIHLNDILKISKTVAHG